MTKSKLQKHYDNLFKSAEAIATLLHETRADLKLARLENFNLSQKIEPLEIENRQLAQWKAEMIAVFNQVDLIRLGEQMGLVMEQSPLEHVNEFVDALILERDVAEARNNVYIAMIEFLTLFTDKLN